MRCDSPGPWSHGGTRQAGRNTHRRTHEQAWPGPAIHSSRPELRVGKKGEHTVQQGRVQERELRNPCPGLAVTVPSPSPFPPACPVRSGSIAGGSMAQLKTKGRNEALGGSSSGSAHADVFPKLGEGGPAPAPSSPFIPRWQATPPPLRPSLQTLAPGLHPPT